MSEHIVNLIRQAEKEYHSTIKNAVTEAERYADDCKTKQNVYIEELEREWYTFERAENEKLEKALSEAEHKLETETALAKERLKNCQRKKLDEISERLREEVLSWV